MKKVQVVTSMSKHCVNKSNRTKNSALKQVYLNSGLCGRPFVEDVIPGEVDGEGREAFEGRVTSGPAAKAVAEQRVVLNWKRQNIEAKR